MDSILITKSKQDTVPASAHSFWRTCKTRTL